MATATTSRRRGEEQRRRSALQSRVETASVSDIGEIPKVAKPWRRKRCKFDLLRFLVTYFPASTGLSPFSGDHERIIRRVEDCVLRGGRFVNAVYRGFAKTTISENTAIWATFYGHRTFIPIFGADAAAAAGNIESIKLEMSDNDLLYEDFPEVCHAVRHLEGRPQRAAAQSYRGVLTHVEWTSERIVLPTIPGSGASGAVICARGITAGFRGLKHKRPDGTQARPDFVILDDPQTDESAATLLQVNKTLAKLRKAIVKLGGHRRQLAMVANATVIEPDDAVDRLLADPSWQGERVPLVRQWPEAHETLWLGQYARVRQSYNKDVEGDQKRAWREATEFYRQNREEMDRGAAVAWASCFDPEHELSALQHAYNALIDDGPEAFASEYQVRPLPKEVASPDDLVAAEVVKRVNGCPRGVVPAGMTRLTAFADVQQDVLYWVACAWQEGFGGAVVDYGTEPDQRRPYFSLGDIRPTLRDATGVPSIEGALYAGLGRMAERLLARAWPHQDGGELRVEKMLVDAGKWDDVIHRFVRQSPHAAVLQASKGVGIMAHHSPMSDWPPKPGERRGPWWVIRPAQPGKSRLALFDANLAKSFVADRLRRPMGEAAGLTLFGAEPQAHTMFGDHVTAERRELTEGRGRKVHVWLARPGRKENHYFDCVVGNAVAASILGVEPAGLPQAQRRERKRVSYRDMQQKVRAGR